MMKLGGSVYIEGQEVCLVKVRGVLHTKEIYTYCCLKDS